MGEVRRKISYCLWFDGQAEAAAEFYGSVFSNAGIGRTERFDAASAAASGQPEGSVLTAEFTIEGDEFLALNGGPHFELNPSISFFVNCRTAGEVEDLWEKLSDGGTALMPLDSYPFSEKYGWIQDRFGVSWQVMLSQGNVRHRIVPSLLFVGEKYGRAEEAAGFYTSVFRNSTMGNVHRYGPDQQPDREGTVAYADFEIEGQLFAVMDSAHDHKFDLAGGARGSAAAARRSGPGKVRPRDGSHAEDEEARCRRAGTRRPGQARSRIAVTPTTGSDASILHTVVFNGRRSSVRRRTS
jgi:predicted 3-demethylubiquinone-9 3-methyltransferase (glyoxalase superfamily)